MGGSGCVFFGMRGDGGEVWRNLRGGITESCVGGCFVSQRWLGILSLGRLESSLTHAPLKFRITLTFLTLAKVSVFFANFNFFSEISRY